MLFRSDKHHLTLLCRDLSELASSARVDNKQYRLLKEIGTFGFVSMMIFLAILVVGFVYEWMKGALEWE